MERSRFEHFTVWQVLMVLIQKIGSRKKTFKYLVKGDSMSIIWTVIVNSEDHGYLARKMYGPQDRIPAWDLAVNSYGQELGLWPIAMFRGDFADNIVTEENKGDWKNE